MKYATSDSKQWANANLKGHLAVTTTPMKDNGDIDWQGMKRTVDSCSTCPEITAST